MGADDDYHVDYNGVRSAEQYAIAIGVISFLFPASVVFILLYRYDKLVRGRSLVHYVLVIAISDSIASLCIALGYPDADKITCKAQSFLLYFFSRSSWLFTDVLMLQLVYVIFRQKYFLSIKYMHAFVWPINIVLQMLPYSTGTTYGQQDDDVFDNSSRCYLVKGKVWSYRWVTYTVDLVLLASLIFIGFFMLTIVIYCYYKSRIDPSHEYLVPFIKKSWNTMILYPIGLIIAWVPSLSYDYYSRNYIDQYIKYPYRVIIITDYLEATNAIYGMILAITFYVKTKEARYEWKLIINNIINGVNDNDDDSIDKPPNENIVQSSSINPIGLELTINHIEHEV